MSGLDVSGNQESWASSNMNKRVIMIAMVGYLLVLELSSSCMFACSKVYGTFRREEICKVLEDQPLAIANAHIAYNLLKFLEQNF